MQERCTETARLYMDLVKQCCYTNAKQRQLRCAQALPPFKKICNFTGHRYLLSKTEIKWRRR